MMTLGEPESYYNEPPKWFNFVMIILAIIVICIFTYLFINY